MSDSALLAFLAHSLELERESAERYEELAAMMETHHNREVAAFFSRMAGEAAQHLEEVEALAAGRELPVIPAWDFQWPDAEPPETTSYEAVHYRMGLADAMRLALRNERAAEVYYRGYADGSGDAEVQRVARLFAEEENSHARQLEVLIEQVPATSPLAREEDDPPHMPE